MDKQQMKNKYGDEKVLCIPRSTYESDPVVWGFLGLCNAIKNDGFFAYRYEVEMDENILQVIPYTVLKHGDKYFITKRLGGDERLKGMTAFLGGHINECDAADDATPYKTIMNCVYRELSEETTASPYSVDEIIAKKVFVDESSQVSRCHICLLLIAEVLSDDVQIKETEKLEGGWVTPQELVDIKNSGKAEGWCKIAIDILTGGK